MEPGSDCHLQNLTLMTPPLKGYTTSLKMLAIRKQEMKIESVEFIRYLNFNNKIWEKYYVTAIKGYLGPAVTRNLTLTIIGKKNI